MDGESSSNDKEITIQDNIASPRKLPFQYLKEITDNFSAQRVLGGGAFGVVYKGVLPNGDVVAVKKLEAFRTGSQKQFENEVYHLMGLNHPNIVRCIGYCYETQNLCLTYDGNYVFVEEAEKLLCLEYMPNGSLDNHLADELCGLDWHKRYNIISGICYGLHYIHTEWEVSTPIVHLDLKPANILLGDNMLPKIADFGLSRLFTHQQTRVWTESRGGTRGYMAPEYINRGIITTKSDIFSLGVIIIEIITGYRKYPWPSATGSSYHDFVELVLKNWRKRSEAVSLETDYEQIRRCLEIGLRCLENDPEKRPATMEIIERLIGRGSTNFVVGSDERSSTLKITSDPKEFLAINPHDLQFCLGFDKLRRCPVQLTNNTAEHVAFSFEVKRARNNYSIEPTSGFLCPRSTFTVFITLEEVCEYMQCSDVFFVQTIIVRENRLTNSDYSFFMSSNVVHKEKLTIAYLPRAQSPNLLSVRKASDPQQLQRLESFSDQENVDTLVRCICQDLGFSNGRPIAACLVYMSILHWKSFEAGKTNVFERIIASMFSTVKAQGNDMLAYWLSNSSTLLLLIQRTLKTSTQGRFTPRRGKSSAGLVEKIIARTRSSGGIRGKVDLQQVEAKRPAQLFQRHLTGFLEKVYGMIRDNMVKDISPLLGCCIEAPTIIYQALFDHWQRILNILTDYLGVLKSNYVPSFLISKMFTQVFSFIDVQLFSSILLSECCSFRDGEYIKTGLAKLEQWCIYETEEYAGSSWEELKHIRKAAIFLTIRAKENKTLEEITSILCPVLSIPQLYRICTLYRDDKYGSDDDSPLIDVLTSMENLMMEDVNDPLDYSLLLDHDSASIPFTVDDILKSMTEFELADVDMPPLIRKNPCFNFLYQPKD